VKRVRLSIVTTLYQSAPYVSEFYTRTCASAERITPEFEIVFVDDGSPDTSLQLTRDLVDRDPRVRIVSLSRNFGHHRAMMVGLAHARGDQIFLIDSDLEVDPEVLPMFVDRLSSSTADVVYGVRDVRQDGVVDRFAGTLFYTVFNWLSPHRLPVNLTTTRLMTRRYVSALLGHQERETIIAGLWVLTGYEQLPVVVIKRCKRESVYSWPRKFAVLTNAITSFSDRPLVLIFYTGLVISLFAAALATDLIARRLLFGTVAEGFLSLIVSTWLLGGLIIFCIGILGIYLSKIFIETKQRPYTIVKEIYDRSEPGE
jgi:putative glycosyltransferase